MENNNNNQSAHLESILALLQKITDSQKELMQDNEIMKQKLQNYENITNIIVSSNNISTLSQDLNVIQYCQDYLELLSVYSHSFEPSQLILDAVSASHNDANLSSLVRIFGMIYFPDNRKRDWNIQLTDKKQHKFNYTTIEGETYIDYTGKNIFNMFMSNYENALCCVINSVIEETFDDVDNGKDPDSAYGMLMHTYNIRKYYSNLSRIKNSSEQFIKKLIQTYF